MSRRCNIPYQFISNNHHITECAYDKCDKVIQNGEWVIERNNGRRYKHLVGKPGKHLFHIEHIVDAKGDQIYDKEKLK